MSLFSYLNLYFVVSYQAANTLCQMNRGEGIDIVRLSFEG